ncbi:MAG: 3-methyl-2-oxobutanoate hydroxymethyltransferase, partial [Proteobacteria bacterium]|nr:3-methyl-2-oxobutanoate hydroxymethyltransferase [Pseudomonadota bacterium]
ECIPDRLAKVITESVSIPTIGIGAGAGCDGQVLVTHDLLGMFDKFVPSFVKGYANLAPQIKDAVSAFKEEVRAGSYPDAKHSFSMQLDVDKLFSDEG